MDHHKFERMVNQHKIVTIWGTVVCVALLVLLFVGLSKCGGDTIKNIYIEEPSEEPTRGPTEQPTASPSPSPSPSPSETPIVCNKVIWDRDVLPIVESKCVSCHPGFDQYESAKANIDEWVRRINLASQDPRRMPKIPRPELSIEEKGIFEKWKADGVIENEECNPQVSNGFMRIEDIEREISDDLEKIDIGDQIFVRYLVASDLHNDGDRPPIEMKKAIDKLLNSIVEKNRDLIASSFVDEEKTIFRFDLRQYELDRFDWLRIEAADKLNLVSATNRGKTLQLLTRTRKPWLHARNFLEIITTNAALYYRFLNVPPKLDDLLEKLEVEYIDDLKNLDATLIGFDDSPLTNQKNRLISRHESLDGFFYQTYDIKPGGDNLFKNPLLDGIGSRKIFKFDASEVIWTLPNGLLGFALFDSRNQIQTEAPVDIVRDYIGPVPPSPVIANPVSCFRCHGPGLLEAKDEIRQSVLQRGSEFDLEDINLIKGLYKKQTSIDAIFKLDNRNLSQALKTLDIDQSERDPINGIRDTYRFNWDAKKLASFLFLSESEFLETLGQSNVLRAELGQLLSGDSVTFDELVSAFPLIIKEFELFQEKENEP